MAPMDLHLSLRLLNYPPFPQPPPVPALLFSPCLPLKSLPIHSAPLTPLLTPAPLSTVPLLPQTCPHMPATHPFPVSNPPSKAALQPLSSSTSISAPFLLHRLWPHLPLWQSPLGTYCSVSPSPPHGPRPLPTAVCPRSTTGAQQLLPALCQQPLPRGQPSPSGCTPLSLASSPARGRGWVAPASHASCFPQPAGCFQDPGSRELLIGFGRAV